MKVSLKFFADIYFAIRSVLAISLFCELPLQHAISTSSYISNKCDSTSLTGKTTPLILWNIDRVFRILWRSIIGKSVYCKTNAHPFFNQILYIRVIAPRSKLLLSNTAVIINPCSEITKNVMQQWATLNGADVLANHGHDL